MVVFHQLRNCLTLVFCSGSVADELRDYSLHFNFLPKDTSYRVMDHKGLVVLCAVEYFAYTCWKQTTIGIDIQVDTPTSSMGTVASTV